MEERRQLRRLIKDGADIGQNVEDGNFEYFMETLTDIQRKNDTIESHANNILQLKTTATRINHSVFVNVLESKESLIFDEDDLVAAIRELVLHEDEIDWSKLNGPSHFKSACLSFPIFGTHCPSVQSNVSTQKRAERRKRPKDDTVSETVPQKLSTFTEDGIENDHNLSTFYQNILRCCNENGAQPFYKIICDPNSFPNSVHNAFQVSFLIQSNLVKVFKSASGETMLGPVDKNLPFTVKKGGDNSVHAVISLDYDLWQASITNYGIENAMILG